MMFGCESGASSAGQLPLLIDFKSSMVAETKSGNARFFSRIASVK
jgi:hypothetical protein